ATIRVTPRGQWRRNRLTRERRLAVVELDVRLVHQADKKGEPEVAVWAFLKREARVPAVQVALQLNRVCAELFGVDVVGRLPVSRPVLCGAESQAERELLAASLARDQVAARVGLGADAGTRVLHRQRETLASRPGPDGRRDGEPQRTTRHLTRRRLGARRRSGGRRRPPAPQPKQPAEPPDRRGGDRDQRVEAGREGGDFAGITANAARPRAGGRAR